MTLLVTRDGKPIDKLFLEKKAKFMLGTLPINDFHLQHPSISKLHASIYFAPHGVLMLVDLGSSHGTVLKREGEKGGKIDSLMPVQIKSGDIITFGLSSRHYTIQISK